MIRRVQKVFTEAARSKQFIEGGRYNLDSLRHLPFSNNLEKVNKMMAYRTYFAQNSPFTKKNLQYEAEICTLHMEKNSLTFRESWRRRLWFFAVTTVGILLYD